MTDLDEQIAKARKEISPDGYEMSIGEIINLYKSDELTVNPEFQRLFRWKQSQKTRFIESLLLGIPVPPIFVFTDQRGRWELVDGLQRLSTIFQFVGILKQSGELDGRAEIAGDESEQQDETAEDEGDQEDEDADGSGPLKLSGTTFLPDLKERCWEPTSEFADDGIGVSAQLLIKRARIRVEILKKESDVTTKYELFQRLNTGGTKLSEQEVRNCTALMINPKFHAWLRARSKFKHFVNTTAQTKEALSSQAGMELALRFVAFRRVEYQQGLDVHEYLDNALVRMAKDPSFPAEAEAIIFKRTFKLLDDALGKNSFKRWQGERFVGSFLMSLFEVVAIGVSHSIDQIDNLSDKKSFIEDRVKKLWSNDVFNKNSGAGVRGTTRLAKLLPLAETYFIPA